MLDLTANTDARPVALTRIGLALAGVLMTLETRAVLAHVADGSIAVPYAFAPLPAPSELLLQVWTVLTLLGCALLALGLFSRAAAFATCGLFLWALLWDQQVYSNHLTLLVLLLLFVGLAGPGGSLSLDARRVGDRPAPWWPQLLLLTQVSVVYLFAGLSKLNSAFLSGDVLSQWSWVPLTGPAAAVAAVAAVVTEVGLAVALWLPRVRVVAAAVGVLLHVSIVVALDNPLVLTAFGLMTVATYPLFLRRPPLQRAGPEQAGGAATAPHAVPSALR